MRRSLLARLIVIAALGASLACSVRGESGTIRFDSATSAGGGYRTTRVGALSDTIIDVAGGDSVELQSAGTVTVKNQPDGLMVTYYPFFDLADTTRVRTTALAVFDVLRRRFENGGPPWIVLRAVNRPAVQRDSGGQDHFFGIVLEKRADGRWYTLHGASPVR
ncbi:MAG: hypothetical protein JWO05_1014 [Gemmatimonadetes bacterium]|nr:hypothetical protein [Gemmatimonadota bacterium]